MTTKLLLLLTLLIGSQQFAQAKPVFVNNAIVDIDSGIRIRCWDHYQRNGSYMEATKIGTMFGAKSFGEFKNYQECLDKLKEMSQ